MELSHEGPRMAPQIIPIVTKQSLYGSLSPTPSAGKPMAPYLLHCAARCCLTHSILEGVMVIRQETTVQGSRDTKEAWIPVSVSRPIRAILSQPSHLTSKMKMKDPGHDHCAWFLPSGGQAPGTLLLSAYPTCLPPHIQVSGCLTLLWCPGKRCLLAASSSYLNNTSPLTRWHPSCLSQPSTEYPLPLSPSPLEERCANVDTQRPHIFPPAACVCVGDLIFEVNIFICWILLSVLSHWRAVTTVLCRWPGSHNVVFDFIMPPHDSSFLINGDHVILFLYDLPQHLGWSPGTQRMFGKYWPIVLCSITYPPKKIKK